MARSTLIGGAAALALLLAGILVSVLGGSNSVLFTVGLAAVGVGAASLALLFFYEVGRSEDRDRAKRPRG